MCAQIAVFHILVPRGTKNDRNAKDAILSRAPRLFRRWVHSSSAVQSKSSVSACDREVSCSRLFLLRWNLTATFRLKRRSQCCLSNLERENRCISSLTLKQEYCCSSLTWKAYGRRFLVSYKRWSIEAWSERSVFWSESGASLIYWSVHRPWSGSVVLYFFTY